MNDVKKLAETLSPIERSIVPVLKDKTTVAELVQATGMKEVQVMRGVQWLKNKNVVKLEDEKSDLITLDKNGKEYFKNGLPERRFLEVFREAGPKKISEILKKSKIDNSEINICLGALKSKLAIDIKRDKELIVTITDQGKKLFDKLTPEERFLKEFKNEQDALDPTRLKDELKLAFDNLHRRKGIIKLEEKKTKRVALTPIGKQLVKLGLGKEDIVDRLTSKMILSGSWQNKKFRAYDVQADVPRIYPGKRHFLNQAIEYVRRIWLDLGFKEMGGNLTQTSFWNFDALFTSQDHPVREMQDTFFIKDPSHGKLPSKKLVDAVRKAHEVGTKDSIGWRYKWSDKVAQEMVLRTHTTVLSAQTLAQLKKEDMPAKYFSVAKCFRNETLDYSHLFEFNQVEGIVVDPKANFRHLLGYLKTFFHKMGYEKVRIRPAYFPYTEPSAEVDVFDKKHNTWIELAGAGIFRPEVVEPLLGEYIPVLAWGLGFARIVPEYYGITDIRDLYRNDLNQLRTAKTWMR